MINKVKPDFHMTLIIVSFSVKFYINTSDFCSSIEDANKNQNITFQLTMDSQKITSEKQTNNTETEQFQNIINKKQEKPQRKKSGGCPVSQQFILDHPMTDRPISVSDVLEDKVTF